MPETGLPNAPDPAMEIGRTETSFSVSSDDEIDVYDEIVSIDVAEPAGVDALPVPDSVAAAASGGELSGSAYAEFWGVDVWDMISAGGVTATGIAAFNALATPPEQRAVALNAAEKLERLSYKYPGMLAWTRSPMVALSGDFGLVAMFFGAKVRTFMAALRAEAVK